MAIFGTTVAQSLKNGGEVVSSTRGSRHGGVNQLHQGKGKTKLEAYIGVRGCFDEDKGRPID